MRQTSAFVESISEMVATTLYVCDSLHSNLEVGPTTFLTGLVFQILTFHEIQNAMSSARSSWARFQAGATRDGIQGPATDGNFLQPWGVFSATVQSVSEALHLPYRRSLEALHHRHATHVQLKTYIALDTIHSGALLDCFYEHTTSSLALLTLLTCMPLTLAHSSTPSLHSTEEPSMLCRIAQGEPAPTAAVAASSGWSEVVPAGPSPP